MRQDKTAIRVLCLLGILPVAWLGLLIAPAASEGLPGIIVLPFQNGVEIIGCVGALLGAQEADLHDVAGDLFKGLSVLLIHGQQKKGQHEQDHADRRRADAGMGFEQEEQRNAKRRARAEADELALRQVQQHLGLDRVQVFGYGNVCHNDVPPSMTVEN